MVVGSHERDVRPVERMFSLSPIVWDIPDAGKPATIIPKLGSSGREPVK